MTARQIRESVPSWAWMSGVLITVTTILCGTVWAMLNARIDRDESIIATQGQSIQQTGERVTAIDREVSNRLTAVETELGAMNANIERLANEIAERARLDARDYQTGSGQ